MVILVLVPMLLLAMRILLVDGACSPASLGPLTAGTGSGNSGRCLRSFAALGNSSHQSARAAIVTATRRSRTSSSGSSG